MGSGTFAPTIGTATIIATSVSGNKTATTRVEVVDQLSDYYWYIGTTLPTSFSNVQTDNTKPGWHEIGSSLSDFEHDMNDRTNWIKIVTKENPTESDMIPYYVIVPNGVSITNALGTDLTSNGQLRTTECDISGYKAFVSNERFITVKGLIIKG